MRGPHDIGGVTAGPVDTAPHDMTFWEKQIDAMNMLLAQKGLRRTDENRRYIEMLGNDVYNTLTYYERWTAALARQLIDKGVLTQDEVDAKIAAVRAQLGQDAADMAPLAPGDRVRVREDFPPGHIRTPVYIRGREGVVTRCFGEFLNPETLAIGRDGLPKKALYEVRFRQRDLWPDYSGPASDTLDIDIYEHWLAKI